MSEEKQEKTEKNRKWPKFFGIFIISFFGSVWFLGALGLAPQSIIKTTESSSMAGVSDFESLKREDKDKNSAYADYTEKPLKIEISKIGVSASVVNPDSRMPATLDEALKEGVVRYPDSALLGSEGNVFLFGHASSLPTVRNPMYKVFSKIRELNLGDDIKVYSNSRVYFYEVVNMALVDKDDALVEFSSNKHKITLSTCNTFGEKSERFVVEANFVESFPLD